MRETLNLILTRDGKPYYTEYRFAKFPAALNADKLGRRAEAEAEIQLVTDRKADDPGVRHPLSDRLSGR